jgi:predicted nucleic acid-binding protein
MPDKVFIDTNIFFYLYSADEPEKRRNVEKAISQYDCVTSTQAVNELSNIFIKKLKLSTKQIKAVIDEIALFCSIIKVDLIVIEQALELHAEYQYSYYDCLMLSAALISGCTQIFTEDLQDGQIIKKQLKIRNIVNEKA